VILSNILSGGQIVQGVMRTDLIVDPFPFIKGDVQFVQLGTIGDNCVKFFQVGAVSSFDTAIGFGGMGRQDK
jgi:hypothetical protein